MLAASGAGWLMCVVGTHGFGPMVLLRSCSLLLALAPRPAPAYRLGEGSVEYGIGMERRGVEPVVYKIERRKRTEKRMGKRRGSRSRS